MPVNKEECVYTFDNQESPYGLDVCLTCYGATSPDPSHNFTQQHYRLTGHSAFLNLHKVAKPRQAKSDKAESPPKKLAIHSEKDEDNFEVIRTFKTLASDKEDDFVDAESHVLSADSYAAQQQQESWELELEVCEHVAIVQSLLESRPQQRLTPEELSHCSQCELSKNLWLCLECGNLGCGRRQFDGSGGNGHALSHFESENHPVSVKLGSITPDGHVDVYCYACNDDRKDPNIREHLAHWGIDVAKQTKTEKSMTELQLEQNMNWDFTGSTNGELVTGEGFTGLANLGNSCYLNSVVQSLFGIPEFAELFTPNDPEANEEGAADDLKTQLRKLKDGLTSGRYDSVTPQMLKYLVGKGHAEFATMRQQDAFEFLTHLLTLIAEKVKDVPAPALFAFETERRILCLNCEAVRYISENQENLSIAVPIEEIGDANFRPVPFTELLDTYTAAENVESTCPRCKSRDASSRVAFKTFPQIFVVNVRRFRIVNWVPEKVNVPVIVDDHLSLDKYLSKGPQDGEDIISNEEDAEAENAFEPDPTQLVMLTSMGFDEVLSKSALQIVSERGQPGDVEAAAELVLTGEAERVLRERKAVSADSKVLPEDLATLESLGFTPEQAAAALKHNDSHIEAAVEWLFSGKYEESLANEGEANADAPGQPAGDSTLPANYELSAIIAHKGASVHVGHYVAAVRKNGEMYLYNDEKVSHGADIDELQKFAYIYLFDRRR